MKTKETSQQLKERTTNEIKKVVIQSTREQALAWWNNLSPYDEQHSLREKYFGNERLTSSLTGREIEGIWRKENSTASDN